MVGQRQILAKPLLNHLNPDGGLPYAPGMPSFSEPTLLMILALVAAGETALAQPLVDWVLRNSNADGSIGLNRTYPNSGLWNTSHLAIVMHHLGRQTERDRAIEFILDFRSIKLPNSPENAIDSQLVGWPWAANTFGWVEPTSWALLALKLAGKQHHPRVVEGQRLLADRSLPQGGWNYGNRIVFNHALVPFWDTTALALMALKGSNKDLVNKTLGLLEASLPEVRSPYSLALVCLSLDSLGREVGDLRNRIHMMLSKPENEDLNLAYSALGLAALSGRRVLTP